MPEMSDFSYLGKTQLPPVRIMGIPRAVGGTGGMPLVFMQEDLLVTTHIRRMGKVIVSVCSHFGGGVTLCSELESLCRSNRIFLSDLGQVYLPRIPWG